MKKLIIVFVLICVFSHALAPDNQMSVWPGQGGIPGEKEIFDGDSTVSSLPLSLEIIEEGTFEGTNLQRVDLPESLKVINDRAFAENVSLTAVYIPAGVKAIGENAFANDSVMIVGESGSFAEQWAYAHGFSFSVGHAVIPDNHLLERKAGRSLDLLPQLLLALILFLLHELIKRKPIFALLVDQRCVCMKECPEFAPIDYSFP